MTPGRPPLWFVVSVAALTAWLAWSQWVVVAGIGDGLSPSADPWTEADTLRAAEGYAASGFAANWGLPDVCYGRQFPEVGTKTVLTPGGRAHYAPWAAGTIGGRTDVGPDRYVYTHYPPGPHLVAGVFTAGLGPGRVSLYRAAPVAVGLAGFLLLARGLFAAVGAVRAVPVLAVAAAVPMFRAMLHGLSCQGYTHALLLAEIGLFLPTLRTAALSRPAAVGLALVGFAQGWLGFDYAFVAVLAPVVLWFVRVGPGRPRWRPVAAAVGAVAAGFTAAHGLHFVQVAGYLGGIGAAVADLGGAARYRAGTSVYDTGAPIAGSFGSILWAYITDYTAWPGQLGVAAGVVAAVGTGALAAAAVFARGRGGAGPDLGTVLAPAAALAVSSLWVAVMAQHAAQHLHFIPRHYFLTLFVAALALASVGTNGKPSDPSEVEPCSS